MSPQPYGHAILTTSAGVSTVARMEGGTAKVLPIQRPTAATALAEQLRDELLSGAIPPGTALHDGDLAARTGLSGSAVRRALTDLAREGLVIQSLRGGVEVARISPDELRDVFVTRRVLERAGLSALLRNRPVDVTWLSAAVERMGEAAVAGDGRAAVEADIAFHLALVASAGAHRLTRAAQDALKELRLILSLADRLSDDLPALVADHQHLVDVIRAGRPRRARAALDDHLLRGEAVALAAAAASEAA
jgi:DNA-binding GntR family transcriptional regulator